ncbi:hypothetical protein GCM10009647_068630 [Streptomyces sanglieri]
MWLYFRFPLSFREVEELMLERGVIVSHETVRRCCAKFGQPYANALRRRRVQLGDKWHLDEVFIKINRERKYLWRAVDADGTRLDILVQNRRDKAAARRFFRRLLKTTRSVPRGDRHRQTPLYGAAHREVMPSVEHRSHKGLNNRAENSHQPTRQRERAMNGFRSVGGAQRFLAAFSGISPHFRPRRHLMTATHYRAEMTPPASASGSRSPASPACLPRPEHGAGTRPLRTRHTIRHSLPQQRDSTRPGDQSGHGRRLLGRHHLPPQCCRFLTPKQQQQLVGVLFLT